MANQLQDFFSDVADESGAPAKYLSIFIDETDESLDALTEILLASEGGADRAATESLLITSHRIKGSAAAVGLNRPAKLAHLMEDVLQMLRETGQELSADRTDIFLRCTDALRNYLDGLKAGNPTSENFNELANELVVPPQEPTPAELPPPVSEENPVSEATVDELPAEEPVVEGSAGDESTDDKATDDKSTDDDLTAVFEACNAEWGQSFAVRVMLDPAFPLVSLKAQLVVEKLAQTGEMFYCDPPSDTIDSRGEIGQVICGVTTDMGPESLTSRATITGVVRVDVVTIRSSQPATTQVAPPASVQPISARPEPAKSVASAPATPGPVGTAQPSAPSPFAAQSKPVSPTAPSPTAPSPTAGSTPTRTEVEPPKPAETLRVDIERLDNLMNLAGELVINKARFTQIGEGLKHICTGRQGGVVLDSVDHILNQIVSNTNSAMTSDNLAGELEQIAAQTRRVQNELGAVRKQMQKLSEARADVLQLLEAVHQLDRVADGIQKCVMDTRMVPIGPLFGRFRRVVRDVARTNNKKIELAIKGETTELDKRMIDELGDPLIHMVRNSADHGIESPEERLALGKSPSGTITLDAFHRGNSIVIQVHDDGKGLDLNRILEKAIERGIVSPADAAEMTPHQVFQLIWDAGFTTAEKVTEVSGRGMGMDIVRSKIEGLNGTVELDSKPGEGTVFSIKLPLTLAILPSLLAVVDDDVFALPLESVVEIVSVPHGDLSKVHGESVARVRGRVVSVVELSELFSWARQKDRPSDGDESTSILVIIRSDGEEVGLVVDHLIGEEDIVIKSLAENYQNVAGIAGASILGDGSVSLILDVTALVEMASGQHSTVAATREENA